MSTDFDHYFQAVKLPPTRPCDECGHDFSEHGRLDDDHTMACLAPVKEGQSNRGVYADGCLSFKEGTDV